MSQLKGVCIGAGYFSRFQYEAWNRIPEVQITAMCNRNAERAQAIQREYGVSRHYGDGWGDDAYLARQPYFRTMPRLLIFETGVHFIDTFRYLGGDIAAVYAILRRLNPVIAGEDTGLVVFEFASGAVGVWDGNRYNECNDPDPRFTFGEFLVEVNGGSLRLYSDGRITIQRLGENETEHEYPHPRRAFSGDCVFVTQRHFVEGLLHNQPFETNGADYLRTLAVQEAVYQSARTHQPVQPITESGET